MQAEKNNPSGAPIESCDLDPGCPVVSCTACLVEIPPDVALTFDGQDYIQHFCGLDCLDAWKAKGKT